MSISPCVLINFGHCKYRLVFCPTNNIRIDFKAQELRVILECHLLIVVVHFVDL